MSALQHWPKCLQKLLRSIGLMGGTEEEGREEAMESDQVTKKRRGQGQRDSYFWSSFFFQVRKIMSQILALRVTLLSLLVFDLLSMSCLEETDFQYFSVSILSHGSLPFHSSLSSHVGRPIFNLWKMAGILCGRCSTEWVCLRIASKLCG